MKVSGDSMPVSTASSLTAPLYQPPSSLDVLRLPLLGRFLRWRWGRLTSQCLLLGLAVLVVYDGFTGPQFAPENSATVLAWVHYRGLVMLALLLAGNLFCFACPFALPRSLARRFSRGSRRWPRALRNKWVSYAGLFSIFWLYEWLDLWASPWLTAWVVVGYFVGSFALEALFAESPFCKYVCPLGTFNFVHSTASPLQIRAREASVCVNCVGKECLNGSPAISGCGTELFVPMIRSNMDCTLCLDCARACPYDNVSLSPRRPFEELISGRWPVRWDLAFVVVSLAFMGLVNAFGMVRPVHTVLKWLSGALRLDSEAVQLLILLGVGSLILPGLAVFGASWLNARLAPPKAQDRPVKFAARYAPAFVPLSLGIWLAHYGFHFAIGGLTIVPVLQALLIDHGLGPVAGAPRWGLSYLLPVEWIFPLQVVIVLAGFAAGLYVLARVALRPQLQPAESFLELLPWAVILAALTVLSLSVFNLPMEMRGAFGTV